MWRSSGFDKVENSDLWRQLDDLPQSRPASALGLVTVKARVTRRQVQLGLVSAEDAARNAAADALATAGADQHLVDKEAELTAHCKRELAAAVQSMMLEIPMARRKAGKAEGNNSSDCDTRSNRSDRSNNSSNRSSSSSGSSQSRSGSRDKETDRSSSRAIEVIDLTSDSEVVTAPHHLNHRPSRDLWYSFLSDHYFQQQHHRVRLQLHPFSAYQIHEHMRFEFNGRSAPGAPD